MGGCKQANKLRVITGRTVWKIESWVGTGTGRVRAGGGCFLGKYIAFYVGTHRVGGKSAGLLDGSVVIFFN